VRVDITNIRFDVLFGKALMLGGDNQSISQF
jgi:hypothetical protein